MFDDELLAIYVGDQEIQDCNSIRFPCDTYLGLVGT